MGWKELRCRGLQPKSSLPKFGTDGEEIQKTLQMWPSDILKRYKLAIMFTLTIIICQVNAQRVVLKETPYETECDGLTDKVRTSERPRVPAWSRNMTLTWSFISIFRDYTLINGYWYWPIYNIRCTCPILLLINKQKLELLEIAILYYFVTFMWIKF